MVETDTVHRRLASQVANPQLAELPGDVVDAALVNGAATHALGFDGWLPAGRLHPPTPPLPAVLARAELMTGTGRAIAVDGIWVHATFMAGPSPISLPGGGSRGRKFRSLISPALGTSRTEELASAGDALADGGERTAVSRLISTDARSHQQ